jgi:hypothetical protein
VEAAKTEITLEQLSVGTRLVVRSRTNWRFAAVARIDEERVVLTVCSPAGHTYRLRREPNTTISIEDRIPVLIYDSDDTWRENFGRYDHRW